MRRATRSGLALALLAVASIARPAAADGRAEPGVPLGLAWGAIAEPETAGATTPGRLAETVEFLRAHGWKAVGTRELAAAPVPARAMVLTFDDPASALRHAVPLLELYGEPALVTVSAAQAEDPSLGALLSSLARTPGIELVPRVEPIPAGATPVIRCGDGAGAAGPSEERELSRLRQTLERQIARLRAVGASPTAVAWAPGTWSGPAEAVAASLGATLHLPTFGGMPPPLSGARVARYTVPPWAGVWAPVQASVHWDPEHQPVRFLEVDAGWICEGDAPEARVARLLAAVRRLQLNGVRLVAGGTRGVWFPTTAAPVRGDVLGPLTARLHAEGVRWVMVDVETTGDRGRDVALATDLARAADLDVALLPPGSGDADRLAEALAYVRPAVRLGWRAASEGEGRAFQLPPFAAGQRAARGLTVVAPSAAAAGEEAARRARGGWQWIGLPIGLAETGLDGSLRPLAAFALPGAGEEAQ